MPPEQPKKSKGKKVTVTDPTSAPAAPPNPEVQPVVDAHIANVGSEHFPGGYFPIPYTQIGAPTSQLARANFHLGARQVTGWRAKRSVGVRQVQFWRAPSPI